MNIMTADYTSMARFLVDSIRTEFNTKGKVFISPVLALFSLSLEPMRKAARESLERRQELINRP